MKILMKKENQKEIMGQIQENHQEGGSVRSKNKISYNLHQQEESIFYNYYIITRYHWNYYIIKK